MARHKRRCIKCELNPEMDRRLVEEVEVDFCPVCHGLWLDQNEIQLLGAKSDAALGELRELVAAEGEAPDRQLTQAPCPTCGGKLSLAALGSFSLEHCTACGGIYLDRGELDRVMYLTRDREDRVATIVALARSVVTAGSLGD